MTNEVTLHTSKVAVRGEEVCAVEVWANEDDTPVMTLSLNRLSKDSFLAVIGDPENGSSCIRGATVEEVLDGRASREIKRFSKLFASKIGNNRKLPRAFSKFELVEL